MNGKKQKLPYANRSRSGERRGKERKKHVDGRRQGILHGSVVFADYRGLSTTGDRCSRPGDNQVWWMELWTQGRTKLVEMIIIGYALSWQGQ